MRDSEGPSPARPKENEIFIKKGGFSMKNLIYNIFGLLALLSICVMPAYTAGPGGFRGPGDFHGPGTFHGSGAFHGSSNFHGHGNSFSARVFIGPGWGPGWWGYPAYPYYPYYSYYPAPPVVVEQQPRCMPSRISKNPIIGTTAGIPRATTPTLNPARADG
jgi:hypothetical protein